MGVRTTRAGTLKAVTGGSITSQSVTVCYIIITFYVYKHILAVDIQLTISITMGVGGTS
jgi:hypothetical protein